MERLLPAVEPPNMLANYLIYNNQIEEMTLRTVIVDGGPPELGVGYRPVY